MFKVQYENYNYIISINLVPFTSLKSTMETREQCLKHVQS